MDLERLSQGPILVVGDVMLDRYVWGEVRRISPEAPVPVVRVQERSELLGGAGNVAANLVGLGCPVALVGVCGCDAAGERLAALLGEKEIENHLLVDHPHPTITKTRVIAQGQQLLRLDDESPQLLGHDLKDQVLALVEEMLPRFQAVILSDYGKGMLQTPYMAQRIIHLCRESGILILVDPKGRDWERYTGANCVTPNIAELGLLIGSSVDSDEVKLAAFAQGVRGRYGFDWLLVTRGPKGMCLVGPEGASVFVPARAREVYDVSGAGDAVIAALAAGVACGLPFPEAAQLANVAAGIVVGKLGTQPVTRAELSDALRWSGAEGIGFAPFKVATLAAARIQVQAWRASGAKIVFTNGCFDLLHPGHIHLLHRAKALGARLVVGLNADVSVRRLKGSNRPILKERDRAALLGSLSCVDLVVIFEEETPLVLIETLRPDVLVKGADYQPDQVVGKEIVEAYGGQVALVPLLEGFSTSGLVRRLEKRRREGARSGHKNVH